jgi:hypothetical protein
MYVNLGCSSLGEPRGTETWSEDQVNQYVNALIESAQTTTPQQTRSLWDQITQSAPQWVTQLIQARTAYQFQQINLDRARQGLPALNPDNYGLPVQVRAGLDGNTMLLVGGAIVALLIILAMRKR